MLNRVNASNGFKRYSLSNITTGAFTLARGGLYLQSALAGPILPIGPNLIHEVLFSGTAAAPDNKDFTYRLWFADRLYRDENATDPGFILTFAGSGQATLSNLLAPVTGGLALTGLERLADTLTWTISSGATTPKGPMALAETGFAEGTSQAWSPADDSPAKLILPTVARATGLYFEFDIDGGSSPVLGANAFVFSRPI